MQNLRPRSSREHRGNISTHRKMEVLDAAEAGSGDRMSQVCFPFSVWSVLKKIQIKWFQMFTARQNLYRIAQHNTIQYDTVWYNKIRHCTIQYGMIRCVTWYSTMRCGMIRYSKVWYNTVYYATIQYDTIQCGTIQHGMIWYNIGLQRFLSSNSRDSITKNYLWISSASRRRSNLHGLFLAWQRASVASHAHNANGERMEAIRYNATQEGMSQYNQ